MRASREAERRWTKPTATCWSSLKTSTRRRRRLSIAAAITASRGKPTNRGRLLRPTRYYAGQNSREQWPEHYTNAIYSDDGGRTWQTSEPFPENGTGEAAIAELSDGRICYNFNALPFNEWY